MTISIEVLLVIESEIAALTPEKYRRPAIRFDVFMDEYGKNLIQAERDKDKLIATQFDWTKMEKFRGYSELLTIAHGERIGCGAAIIKKPPEYSAKMAVVKADRRYLFRIARHIADMSNDKNVKQSYSAISKGTGELDILNDILSLVHFIRRFPEYAQEISPSGIKINEEYMDKAIGRAKEVFVLRGDVIKKGELRNKNTDRQNRILTLCLNAQSEIKKFADFAFYENPEYYRTYYASKARKQSKASVPVPMAESVVAAK